MIDRSLARRAFSSCKDGWEIALGPVVSLIFLAAAIEGLRDSWGALGPLTRIYLTGVISYWLWFLFTVFANCLRTFSIFDKNMAQMGLRRDVFTGLMAEKQSLLEYLERVWDTAPALAVASLLSWFVYFLEFYWAIREALANWKKPRKLKEIEWVLKHHLLSPLDVVRFNVKATEIILGRRLTEEECNSWQKQLDARGVDIKMSQVLELSGYDSDSAQTHFGIVEAD
jgi:hypothetical protein